MPLHRFWGLPMRDREGLLRESVKNSWAGCTSCEPGFIWLMKDHLAFAHRSYGLPVRDKEGHVWDFVVKSWANGTEHRRVYVLEHVMEYISCKRLREGDTIGICADTQGALMVEVKHICRPT